MQVKRLRTALTVVSMFLTFGPAIAAGPAACPALYPGGTVAFAGLFPAIEEKMPLSNFKKGMIVEIDLATMTTAEAREYIPALQKIGARVSIYLVGGHCTTYENDCARLEKAGVTFGSTGSWNWDKEERRIYVITHPAFVKRVKAGAEKGWRAGANYIRIDNLHYPAGSKEPRTAAAMKVLFDVLLQLEDDLRAEGAIPADRPTGVVAHNNLEVWEEMIKQGMLKRPPVFLTSERTAQLALKGQGYKADALMKAGKLSAADHAEISAGRRISSRIGIPYTIAEFQATHDLGAKQGATYQLPASYVEDLKGLPGVTEVIVIPDETHYVGRGKAHAGPGPKALAATPFPEGAGELAAACLAK